MRRKQSDLNSVGVEIELGLLATEFLVHLELVVALSGGLVEPVYFFFRDLLVCEVVGELDFVLVLFPVVLLCGDFGVLLFARLVVCQLYLLNLLYWNQDGVDLVLRDRDFLGRDVGQKPCLDAVHVELHDYVFVKILLDAVELYAH